MLEKLLEWDEQWLVYLNGLGNTAFDQFWITITDIQTWIPLYLFCLLLFAWKMKRAEAILKIVTVFVLFFAVYYTMHFTKEFFERPRPNNAEDINTIIRVLRNPNDFSFFSGHAATSFSLTTFVFLSLKDKLRWIGVLFLWPLLFSYSRIYVGVHYPLDIVMGTIVGVLFGLAFFHLSQKITALYLK